MALTRDLINNSDTLVELLAAQCAELEKLLALAREETEAASDGRFLRVWDIVSERAAVGKRLETFQQQITELRGALESDGHALSGHDITDRVIELANLTLVQDQKTRLLLAASREKTAADLKDLDTSNYRTNAYLRENTKGLAYDRNF
jgi:flagellar biosynthesis/type III secretory pathway chaperone